ncbi:MAG: hypothetical protein AB1443_03390 [Pseudomonadota bacterium]
MRFLAALLLSLAALAAYAEDNVLLVQTGPQGFVVWHTEGESQLTDDEVLELMATATPAGGQVMSTPLGSARAFEVSEGIVIRLLDAQRDKALLVDRDACGHVHLWHAEGTTRLSDEQLAEVVLSALPEGGPRIRLNGKYAKGFIGRLGVTVTLWKVPVRN